MLANNHHARRRRRVPSGLPALVALLVLAGLLGPPWSAARPAQPGPAAQGTNDPRRFAAVKGWTGTFSWTMSGGGQQGDITWEGDHYAAGSFATNDLDTSHPDFPVWDGPGEGYGRITDRTVEPHGNCVTTMTMDGAGAMPGVIGSDAGTPAPLHGGVAIDLESGKYFIRVSPETLDIHYVYVDECPYGTTVSEEDFSTALGGGGFSAGLVEAKLPDSGLVLSGSRVVRSVLPLSLWTGDEIEVEWAYSWHIEPQGAEELEVVVEPQGYDTWRPEAKVVEAPGGIAVSAGARPAAPAGQEGTVAVEQAGNQILVRATLQTKDGGAPQQKAEKFLFELAAVSREPGATMNYPLNSRDADKPDLRMDLEQNPPNKLRILDPDGQRAETVEPQILQAAANVSSYDRGAYGVIRVTAVMPGGKQIVGYLKGDKAQKEVRLPKREPNSLIAEVWKKNYSGLKDNDDSENNPVGDQHKGDGLTLYEEYRGFYENGVPIEGDPKKKDFFIRDEVGWNTEAGIQRFIGATKLKVHFKLKATELRPDRVINANRRAAPHVVDQHAVILAQGNQPRESQAGQLHPGTPKLVDKIRLARELKPPAPRGANNGQVVPDAQRAWIIAHELLHSASVWHHGEGDAYVLWMREERGGKQVIMEYQTDKQGRKTGSGTEVRVFTESDETEMGAAEPEFDQPWRVMLGAEGGLHSGDANCLMRYTVAEAYVGQARPGAPQVRYYTGAQETPGFSLCTLPAGTGVNGPANLPQPRYGDATRGNCAGQLDINDLYADDSKHDGSPQR